MTHFYLHKPSLCDISGSLTVYVLKTKHSLSLKFGRGGHSGCCVPRAGGDAVGGAGSAALPGTEQQAGD